jgi:hypothetical protein
MQTVTNDESSPEKVIPEPGLRHAVAGRHLLK